MEISHILKMLGKGGTMGWGCIHVDMQQSHCWMLMEIMLRVTGMCISFYFLLPFTIMTTIDGICLVICVSYHRAQWDRALTNTLKKKIKAVWLPFIHKLCTWKSMRFFLISWLQSGVYFLHHVMTCCLKFLEDTTLNWWAKRFNSGHQPCLCKSWF